MATVHRVYDVLVEMKQTPGLDPVKHLFWTELNYDRANRDLSMRGWPDSAIEALVKPPTLLATAGGELEGFNVIYCQLDGDLLITPQRPVIRQLLKEFPYSLFIFSDEEQRRWHFVNVKYDKEEKSRRLFRRITIGPNERLRTASERLALLDPVNLGKDLFGIHPLTIQQAHDEAFDVEAVTEAFFRSYQQVFRDLQDDLDEQTEDLVWAHDYALQVLNRIMFLYFVQRKGWLGDDPEFIESFWRAYGNTAELNETFYEEWLQVLFFEAFNNRFQAGRSDRQHFPDDIREALAMAPYLNGGLFERNDLDRKHTVHITDRRFERIFDFFSGYNFTISEDTPLDQEVAVDPEMIGKVYESLVNVSEEADERGEAGIFYTPRTEIDLMCRLSLVDWLSNHLGEDYKPLLYEVVFAFGEEDKLAADAAVREKNLWPDLHDFLSTVQVVDPACGSGSFLVGMLNVLTDLLQRADDELGEERTPYERRRHIIGSSLYGVDVMEWAVHVAELRLWLQLVIETNLEPAELKFRPLLPNLSFKLRVGDSLVQEVGDINLALRHGGIIPPHLKGRITQLKAEKLKYYYNEEDRKYRSVQEAQIAELQLFRDILEAREHALEEAIKEKKKRAEQERMETMSLPGIDDVEDTVSQTNRKRTLAEIEKLDAELARVRISRQALRKTEDIPFVWDVAFVEVFEGENEGFDIIIGNPPYVRQENIAPPNAIEEHYSPTVWRTMKRDYKDKLVHSVYSAYPNSFGYDWNSQDSSWRLSKKNDLYIYFYFHSLSLLNRNGTFCFITTNSWLDVGYGADLQRFLATRSLIKIVIDNQVKRSFSSASVNTVIVLLGAPQDIVTEQSLYPEHVSRFVMLGVPFEVILSPIIWEEIEEAELRESTPEYRIYPITQSEMLAAGLDPTTRKYIGGKWGSKYLRAPDIYWEFIERASDKLIPLSQLINYDYGIKSGAVDFFYVSQEDIDEWGIAEKYLEPLINTTQTLSTIYVEPTSKLFYCHESKEELHGTGTLEYIKWGESRGYHKRSSVRSHRPYWYSLHGEPFDFLLLQFWNERFWTPVASEKIFCSNNFFYGVAPRAQQGLVAAFLNSTVHFFQIEVMGRTNQGEGILNTYGPDFAHIKVLNPAYVEKTSELIQAFEELATRPVQTIQDEVQQADRRKLDLLICEILGLTATELDEIYAELVYMVNARLERAQSV